MRFGMVCVGANAPNTVNVIVEIPKGSTNKYEIEHDTGLVRFDRVLFSPLFYPCDYGFIPETLYSDGDPLDAFVLLTHPTFPGCIVDAKPIGILGMWDEKDATTKLFASQRRTHDLAIWRTWTTYPNTFAEKLCISSKCSNNLKKSVEILRWDTKGEARRLIEEFRVAR
ncbi:MAG: inorganic diphosphatase [Fimbriimonadales bacterium]